MTDRPDPGADAPHGTPDAAGDAGAGSDGDAPGDAPDVGTGAEASSDAEGSVRVVGTAHVSEESAREVEAAIDESDPDVVAVELDEGRYRQLQGGAPDDLEPADLLEGNTVFQFIAYWMLSYVQSRMGEKFDVRPGADMLAAVEAAEERGIEVALVDRDIQTTIQRFWARMSTMEKLRMASGLLFGATDGRIVGVTLGLFVGLIAGPIVGLFGGALGVTDALLVRATGALLLGVGAGFVGERIGSRLLGPDEGLLAGAATGVAVGGALGGGLGIADGVVATYLGGFAVRALGSMTVGVTAGVLAGGVVGVFLHATGIGEPDPEEFEEVAMEDLTDADVVTALMDEFRQFSPGGAEALIDERDAYIAHRLVDLRAAGKNVVAVVGAGHREGIEGYLDAPGTLPPLDSLTGTTGGGRFPWGKAVGVAVSAAFVAFFVLLAVAGVRDAFLLRLFGAWFLVNGVFAAGLARLVGARWRSALVGGAVAWMTSVNPLLAPGWFAGYVELRHTTVNVSDVTRLNDLLSDETRPVREIVSEMLDVPLFRLIVIVAMTNVGSMVASLLFAAYLLPVFAADLGGVDGVGRLMIEGARRSADFLVRLVGAGGMV
ncbi:MAG: TraB/GumN family protein [Haloferacaceae archaeon]